MKKDQTTAPRLSKLGTPALKKKLQDGSFSAEQAIEAQAIIAKREGTKATLIVEKQELEVAVQKSEQTDKDLREKFPANIEGSDAFNEANEAVVVDEVEEPLGPKATAIKNLLKKGIAPAQVKKDIIALGYKCYYSEVHRVKMILEGLKSK